MKEKEKMLDKKILNFKSKKITKKKSLQEKGITLIALVVTIIILLILAGVTLNIALSDNGLFSKTKEAAEKYKKAQEDEAELISDIGKEMNSEYVGAYVTGYTPTNGICTITKEQSGVYDDKEDTYGTEIKKDENGNQKFTTEEEGELKWRIWDYDGTTLRIILDKPTTQKLVLQGATGYNNGVWAINEVCRKCFGQYEEDNYNGKMKTGITVANLRRSDIEKVSTFDYTKFAQDIKIQTDLSNEELIQIHYGEVRKYDVNFRAPTLWSEKDSKWDYKYGEINKGDASCENPWEQEFNMMFENQDCGSSDFEFKKSYYVGIYQRKTFKNSIYYDICFTENGDLLKPGKETSWLAGRCVFLNDKYCNFGLGRLDGSSTERGCVHYNPVYSSNDDEYSRPDRLRPIVSINMQTSGFKLIKDSVSGNYNLIK